MGIEDSYSERQSRARKIAAASSILLAVLTAVLSLLAISLVRRSRIRFEGLAETANDRLEGREPSPAQAYDDRHFDADVQAALDALSPEFRAAVVLCDIEGLSYEEIAATLGVKLGTVRSRIHRGRAQLRAALQHRRQAAERVGEVTEA